jgi:hypothetical protein
MRSDAPVGSTATVNLQQPLPHSVFSMDASGDPVYSPDAPAIAPPPALAAPNFGDVTGTGNITLADAIAVARYAMNIDTTPIDHGVADVTNTGVITLADAIRIARFAMNIDLTPFR